MPFEVFLDNNVESQPYTTTGMLQVVKGADVVQVIERAKTDRFDKPVEDIKIINIETRTSVE